MQPTTLVPGALKAIIAPTFRDNENINLARELFQKDKTLDPQLRGTIINVVLADEGLPDAGRTAKIILQFYNKSDHAEYKYDTGNENIVQGRAVVGRSILSFPETFVAGMNFLRHYGDIRDGDGKKNQNIVNLGHRCPFRLGPLCEITGDHGPAAGLKSAYILPYNSSKDRHDPRQEQFWDLLRFFWSLRTVEQIKAACTRPGRGYQAREFSNSILMSSVCRKSFDALEFYLLLILDYYTPYKYSVEFHWVHKPHQNERTQHNFRLKPFVTNDLEIEHGTFSTGDEITFETTDPVKYPLPDPGLLMVRALLTKFSLPMESAVLDNMNLGKYYNDFIDDDKQSSDRSQGDNSFGSIEDWLARVPDRLGGGPCLDTIVEE